MRTPAELKPAPLGQRQPGYADGNDPRPTRRARAGVALAARRSSGRHHLRVVAHSPPDAANAYDGRAITRLSTC